MDLEAKTLVLSKSITGIAPFAPSYWRH